MNNKFLLQIKSFLIISFGIIILSIASSLIRNYLLDDSLNIVELFNKSSITNQLKINYPEDSLQVNKKIDLTSYLESLYDNREYQKISIDTAYLIHSKQKALFVDARSNQKFSASHIEDAINIPYDKDNIYDSTKILYLQHQSKPIVFYCNDSTCKLGSELASHLINEYYLERVLYYEGGYSEWESYNYPIVSTEIEVNRKDIPSLFRDNLVFDDYLTIISIILSIVLLLFVFFKKTHYSILINILIILAKLLLSYIFISFSIDKIIDPYAFVKAIGYYDIIPHELSFSAITFYPLNIGCLILPWMELIIGLTLVLTIFNEILNLYGKRKIIQVESLSKVSSFIILSLLILFIVMLIYALANGKSIECGCKLSDDSAEDYEIKFRMIKRIVVDFYLLSLAIFVKYSRKILRKNV